MEQKQTLAIICGGMSGEHSVSLISAKNIYQALTEKSVNEQKFDVVVLVIDKTGHWHFSEDASFLKQNQNVSNAEADLSKPIVNLIQGGWLIDQNKLKKLIQIDICFPITHGTIGEDGSLQGFLRTLGVAYIGPDVWGSAICMDKDITKKLLVSNGIKVTPSLVYRKNEAVDFDTVTTKLGLPLFIKPARLGSALGVEKVKNKDEFDLAIKKSFEYGNKTLVEQAIVGREIECAVLGNHQPKTASAIGEIIAKKEFYDYEAKYLDKAGAELIVDTKIEEHLKTTIRETAQKAFIVLECQGLSRIDFFLKDNGAFYLNEVNTLPGFTNISMYPKLWEASGIAYSDLIEQLANFAFEYYAEDRKYIELSA